MDRGDVSLKDVFRTDRGELRPVEVTNEGFLRVDAYIARPGIYNYHLADGTIRRELVPKSTLTSKASLDTLKLKAVTNDHPDPNIYPNMVDPFNYKELSVGSVGQEVTISEDGRPRFEITVMDASAIADIQSGKLYLSPGYKVDLIMESGVDPDFGKYDAIQTNRRYNHLALTDSPRGGDTVCLRLDGAADLTDLEPEDKMDLIDLLMKKHPGLSRADAEEIASGAVVILKKATQLDALPEGVLVEDFDFDTLVAAKAKLDALPLPEVLKAERTTDRVERVKLDAMVVDLKLNLEETVKLDNIELKSAILTAAKVDVPKVDGLTDEQAARFAWSSFDAQYKAPAEETHVDSDDDPGAAFAFDPFASQPAGGNVMDRYDSTNTKAAQ